MTEKGHHVLEIGPGDQPRHDLGEFSLADNETYFAIDKDPRVFRSPIWQQLRKRFGDRVRTETGKREAIAIRDNTCDEVVNLGSHHKPMREIPEIDRVLNRGGILRLGVIKKSAEEYFALWRPLLEKTGFCMLGTQSIDINVEISQRSMTMWSYTSENCNVTSSGCSDHKLFKL